ncbi:DEKNAAC100255 [Brettanomyces naardenensis]|uniref:DEKNAAC100256 n=1 Tax=Brettanomyces naardenensis TaxID=13370 RepID=A0A448YGJ4_BRENA|nr:DEKNAAC100255 [Brettanomyces naardenensis]
MVKSTTIEEPFIDVKNILAEAVTYDYRNHSLIWVDILKGLVLRTFLDENDNHGEVHTYEVDKYVGLVGLTEDMNKVVTGTSKSIKVLDFNTGKIVTLADYPNGNVAENGWQLRTNDGSVDVDGNFWVGTICDPSCPEILDLGALYRLNKKDLKLEVAIDHVGIPNGINWRGGKMYWASSKEQIIYKTQLDEKTGLPIMSSQIPFVEVSNIFRDYSDKRCLKGEPDGSSFDEQGYLYSAVWGTNRVIKISPEGKLVEEFIFPDKGISCTTIGGRNMNQLFVTSGSNGGKPKGPDELTSGRIFKVDLGTAIKGMKKNLWKGPLSSELEED